MIVPAASALLFAGAVAGSGNALFSRQDSGRSDGIVQLDSTSSWFIPSLNITLGTPGKVLAASLDLFSGETLVMPDAFRANDSSTLKRGANATFERVGDPPLTVTTGSDELAIAGWRVTDAPILFLDPEEAVVPGSKQATLGLGAHRAVNNASVPLWRAWPKPFFGLFLRRAKLEGPDASPRAPLTPDVGSISFGRLDDAHADGEPTWLETDGLWSVRIDKLALNGAEADLALLPLQTRVPVGATNVSAGDGTQGERLIGLSPVNPYLGFPSPVVDALMANVSGAVKLNRIDPDNSDPTAFWSVPCDAKLELKVTLNGTEYAMDTQDLTTHNGYRNAMNRQGAPPTNSDRRCTVLLYSTPEGADWESQPWLGLPFLRTVYSVWDLSVPRVGFTKVKQQGDALTSTYSAPAEEFDYVYVPAETTTTGRTYGSGTAAPSATAGGVGEKKDESGASPRALTAFVLAGAGSLAALAAM